MKLSEEMKKLELIISDINETLEEIKLVKNKNKLIIWYLTCYLNEEDNTRIIILVNN